MREIKTEAQTLDLSKKITVEVSLAELIVLSAALVEIDSDVVYHNLEWNYNESMIDSIDRIGVCTSDIAENIGTIISEHIPKEDE
ncbi:hypothetical protein [Bacillus pumilus]|jgi:hypothetical protein|uniref:hypothetical protein n=1 Tax=Bacillus pumilus TaxID=1408 RepID=UPI0008201438|nr:hypothetical protein [Bacillus pumilus]AOC55288.1 hypothetical protein BEN31_00040 [Bacillus pumilus]MBR0588672.1 hypothetical protein [Bacillus pumilus DW2J2]MBR0618640.1 hypothetical protein [Bacillus pumilus]MBR0624708.1 hypothetical protein [Bacillus pumilus]MCY7724065.1 hypothetical protein [Bacillus pumilus]